jgi:hypothetical protein
MLIFIITLKQTDMNIANKDWERMLSLVLTDSEGESVSKSIKDKDKAIARFICGQKLCRIDEPTYEHRWGFEGPFACFGNRALELGADFITILNEFRRAEVPQSIIDKRAKYNGKKMDSWVVSHISKAIIDAGFDINYLNNGGYALTQEGRWAMERNGRKWTIGYRTEVKVNDAVYSLVFDAITCEGGGPSSYVISGQSDRIFNRINGYERLGKVKFTSSILEVLKQVA